MARVYLAFLMGAVMAVILAGTRLRSDPRGAAPARLEASDPTAQTPIHPGAEPVPFAWNGAGSCASTACHGADGVTGAKGAEYTTWAKADPHARAFEVLRNDKSRRIAQVLQADRPQNEQKPAWEMVECLACHSAPDSVLKHADRTAETRVGPFPTDSDDQTRAQAADGVSCEACHGGSERWLAVHTGSDWRNGTLDSATKEKEYGLRDSRDPLRRATMCLACHSGSGDRQVDHDLIAAGHPRLFFEYSAFHDSPGGGIRWHWHWNRRQDGLAPGMSRAADWAIGQVANAISGLELLADRAVGPHAQSSWPELAEFDCYACHQDLGPRVSGKRVEAPWNRGAAREGSLVWGTWNYVMLHRLAAALEESGSATASDIQWPKLAEHLTIIDERLVRPFGEQGDVVRDEVARSGLAAADILRSWLPFVRRMTADSHWIATTRNRMLEEDGHLAGLSWDAAAQLYLALGALSLALDELGMEPQPDRVRHEYRRLAEVLRFPESLDSPGTFDVHAFRRALEAYGQSVGR